MKKAIGVGKLRRILSRAEHGERLVVTKGRRPAGLDRLIAEGRVSRPARATLPEPLALDGDPRSLSRALAEVRGGP
jgi:hypothetical protein